MRAVETDYDLRNRIATLNRGGSISRQLNDALGNLIEETDPNQTAVGSGIATTHNYDALNRLIQSVNTLGGITAYGYDTEDRLREVQAPNNATTQYHYDDLGNLLQEISPDRGTTTYTYDAAGNVTSQTDARGITTSYTHDALNRLTRIDYPGASEDITLTYDASTSACTFGLGRLCNVQDESGSTAYAYDPHGNITAQFKTELGQTYTTRYTYDARDRTTSLAYPDGRTVTYRRDILGRIESVSAPVSGSTQPLVSHRTYRADGLRRSQTYGNGLTEVRDHDLRGLLTYQSLGAADTRVYSYDFNGNLTQQQTLPEVATYTYDPLDRLTAETPVGGNRNAYTYDPNGNRLSTLDRRGRQRPYTYEPAANRLTQTGRDTLTLDPAGYTLSDNDGERHYTWNGAGRLKELRHHHARRATYTYNYLGQRTRKVTRRHTTLYHYDLNGHLIAETDPTGELTRAYVWVEDEPVAQLERHPRHRHGYRHRDKPEELLYLHTDHLQTPRLATDRTQRVAWRFESDAFGIEKAERARNDDHERTEVRLRFAGQYYDQESGLHYNWNRYYDPRTGRYISSDPIGLRGGSNTYLYASANPSRFVDTDGLLGRCGMPGAGCNPPPANRLGPFGPVCGTGSNTTWIPDGPWKNACQLHDKCYETCGASRILCDLKFIADGGNIVYFVAIVTFGRQAYLNAQEESCCGGRRMER